MLKNILNLNNVQKLDRNQKANINGGNSRGPICEIGPFTIDCSTNTDGRCTCVNGRCVTGPSTDCR
ncbi:hypothetical protein [Aquimarina algicola]|uniref:Uncharacterized protein n=1 Tax=Aquimarina algicola TaxID=2589995 RepID=A0A504JPI0_9FLAO|nr:hypothetical protein [Aquimarina algicola]TPN88651.1 hypothetical protein FHK87_00115 [Aquimarina algicola]